MNHEASNIGEVSAFSHRWRHLPVFLLASLLGMTTAVPRAEGQGSADAVFSSSGYSHLGWPFESVAPSDWSGKAGSELHCRDDFPSRDWNLPEQRDDYARVHASLPGEVIYVENTCGITCSETVPEPLRPYGNQVVIAGPNNLAVRYAHLFKAWVKEGDMVDMGQLIGQVGQSGTDNFHLHLAVYRDIHLLSPKDRTPPRTGEGWLRRGLAPHTLTEGTCSDPTIFSKDDFDLHAGDVGRPEGSQATALPAFVDAYFRDRGLQSASDPEKPILGYDQLGYPVNRVHCWSQHPDKTRCTEGVFIQDFRKHEAPRFGDDGETALVLATSPSAAHLIREGFWGFYKIHQGFKNFGAPLGEEFEIFGGKAQAFDQGRLEWNASTGSITFVRGAGAAALVPVQIRSAQPRLIVSGDRLVGSTPLVFEGCSGCRYSMVAAGADTLALRSLAASPEGSTTAAGLRFAFTAQAGMVVDLDALAGQLDAFNWERVYGGTTRPKAIAYGNGKFVAVGRNGLLMSSPDGHDWSEHRTPENPSSLHFADVAYGQGKWVAIGKQNNASVVLHSTDALAWTRLPTLYTPDLRVVHFANGRWVMSGDGSLYHSATGTSWTAASLTGPIAGAIHAADFADLAFDAANGRWIAVSDLGQPNSLVATSADGIGWRFSSLTLGNYRLRGVDSHGGVSIAAGYDSTSRGILLRSLDGGLTWSGLEGIETYNLYDVVATGEQWIAAGPQMATSADGLEWTVRDNNFGAYLQNLAFAPESRILAAIDTAFFYLARSGSEPLTFPIGISVIGEGRVDFLGNTCPGDCHDVGSEGTLVSLEATPAPGWKFARWRNHCAPALPTCELLLAAPTTEVAEFVPDCRPPLAGDWALAESCTFTDALAAPASVIVAPGAVLTIAAGAILEIDLHHHKLLVRQGGGVLVRQGGTIRQTSGALGFRAHDRRDQK